MASAAPRPRERPFDPGIFSALAGLQLKARYVMEGFLTGVHRSPFHGMSVEFSEYRDYQPGDDPRRIDWRLYARSDRLCVRRYEQETNTRCHVLLDTSASMAYRGSRAWGSKLEAARVLGAAIGGLLLKQNDAVGALSLGRGDRARWLPPSRKPGQLGVLLGHLERLDAEGGARLPALLAQAARLLHRRSLVVLLTDLLEPAADLERPLQRLIFDGHDCILVQVLDPDEEDFPFEEAAVFEDLETQRRRRVRPGAGERYRERYRAFMDAHADLLAQLAVTHATVRTNEDPRHALARLIAFRTGRR